MNRSAVSFVALAVLLGGMLFVVPEVAAQACTPLDDFEDDAEFQPPTGCFYTTSNLGTTKVTPLLYFNGAQSLDVPGTSRPYFLWEPTQVGCKTTASTLSSVTASFAFRVSALPAATIGLTGPLGKYFEGVPSNYAVIELEADGDLVAKTRPTNQASSSDLVGTVVVDTWYHLSVSLVCDTRTGTGVGSEYFYAVLRDANLEIISGGSATPVGNFDAGQSVSGSNIGAFGDRWFFAGVAASQHLYVDDFEVSGLALDDGPDLPAPASNQVAVTGLTGYSMDAGGRNIVTRESDGDVIKTYGVADLTQIATATASNCVTRSDGVNAALYHGEIWITYVDCDGDGESDAFRIRDTALAVPSFPCDEATGNIDNNGQVDVPNNLGDIGTISDLNPSFIERCGDAGLDDASVGWTFSTIGGAGIGGRIGAFGVVYNSGIVPDGDDEVTVALDTSSSPSISQFCSWQDATGRDYIGATADNGPTGIYEVTSSVTQRTAALGKSIDVALVQKFLNSGTYGNAAGIACANNIAVIQLGSTTHVLLNITGTPTVAPGWPKASPSSHERGVAITGSGQFIAVNTANLIHVYALNGTETADPMTEPAGTWRGMEFDHSGEHLAIFTSSFITMFETQGVTCGTVGNCAELGDLEEEGGPDTGDDDDAGGDDDSAGGGVASLGATGNLLAALATVVGFVLLGVAMTRRKGGGERDE